MAITLYNKPHDLVPGHNNVEFWGTSSQNAQPNFVYYITIQVGAGPTYIERVSADPNGDLYWNAVEYTRKYLKNFYPYGWAGWSSATDGICEFTINIGEEYGTTPTIYTGSTYVITAWNGALTLKDRSTYLPSAYQVETSRNDIWLNDLENGSSNQGRSLCKSNQDFVFYLLMTGTYQIDKVEIITYDSAGSTLGTSYIANPDYPPVVSQDKYSCINLGPNGLQLLSSGLVTGTYPVWTGSVASYRIRFFIKTGGGGYTYAYRYVDVEDCAPRFEDVTVMYLNKKGAFDYLNFYGNHSKQVDITKSYYKGLSNPFEASFVTVSGSVNTNGPNPLSINKKPLSVSYETKRTFISRPLNQFQMDHAIDLMSSPKTVVNSGLSDYQLYSVENTNYQFRKMPIDKIVQLELQVTEGITERRQFE